MASSDVNQLCNLLLRLQLVSQSQLDECLLQGTSTVSEVNDLYARLEAKSYLTSYQITRLKKGETGGLVLGGYKLMYQNAAGSFARVFRGCSVHDGSMLGLKVLRQRWAKDPKAVSDFHREAELGKSLQHENIVPIYEVGQDGEYHYLTMQFVEGGNLRDFINIRKKLAPREAIKCVLEMAEGLQYAIGRGFTHRDLKMTNVLMSAQGTAMLVDFGLAGKSVDGEQKRQEGAQRALEYATLEKNTGAPRDDPRSDLYFLGAILYELVSGIPPLPRTRDRAERSAFSRYKNVRPIGDVEPQLPRSVEQIVDRLMNLNPSLRYQNTGEVLRDLRPALAELTDGAAGSNGDTPPARPAAPAIPTVMCIENRLKQQDMLREYFSKHKYRVLVLGDLQRGLERLKTTPPHSMVIMGEAVGEEAIDAFRVVQKMARGAPQMTILVLPEKQAKWKSKLQETSNSRVLVQPVTLRDLRKVIGKPADDNGTPTDDD